MFMIMLPDDIKKFLKENLVWLAVAGIFLISINPRVFIPLIIIAIILYKPIKQLINNLKPMEGKTIDYTNIKAPKIKSVKKLVIGIVIALVVLILLINMIVVIPAGHTGVYHLFGKVKDKEIKSGIHLINPLANVQLMSIRTEQYTMSIVHGEGERLGDDSIDALMEEKQQLLKRTKTVY